MWHALIQCFAGLQCCCCVTDGVTPRQSPLSFRLLIATDWRLNTQAIRHNPLSHLPAVSVGASVDQNTIRHTRSARPQLPAPVWLLTEYRDRHLLFSKDSAHLGRLWGKVGRVQYRNVPTARPVFWGRFTKGGKTVFGYDSRCDKMADKVNSWNIYADKLL